MSGAYGEDTNSVIVNDSARHSRFLPMQHVFGTMQPKEEWVKFAIKDFILLDYQREFVWII